MKKLVLTLGFILLATTAYAEEAKQADPLLEIINEPVKKEVKQLKEKKNSSVVKELGGQKYRVFKNKVDELPQEVNIIFVTEDDFKKLEKEHKAKIAEEKKALAAKKTEEAKALADKKVEEAKAKVAKKAEESKLAAKKLEDKKIKSEKVITKKETTKTIINKLPEKKVVTTIVEPLPVKEVDPEPTLMVEHPVTALEVEGAANSIEIKPKETPVMVVDIPAMEEKKPEVVAAPAVPEEIKEADVVVATEEKDLVPEVAQQVPAASPIKLMDKEQLRNMLNEELSKDISEYRPTTLQVIDEEKQKVSEVIEQKIEQKKFDDAVAIEKEKIKEDLAKSQEIRENAPLADKEESGKAASDKELAPVKLNAKKDKPADKISLPEVKAPVKELSEEEITELAKAEVLKKKNQMDQITEPKGLKKHVQNLNLLNEADGIEEATGPNYGFGVEP